MDNLYLIRHGETEYNRKKLYYGATDCPLNDQGRSDAKHLGVTFAAIPLDLVIASPMQRTRETAALLLTNREVPLEYEERLREINFGAWEGCSWRDLKDDPLWQAWGQDWLNTVPPDGESFVELAQRVDDAYEDLIQRPEKNVAVVVHHMVLMALTCRLLGITHEHAWHFRFLPGAYTHFQFDTDFPILTGFNKI